MQVEYLSSTRKWLLDYPVFHIDLKDTLSFVKNVGNNIVDNNPCTDIILVGTGLSGAMLCSSIATYIYTYLDFRWNIGVQILRKPEDNNNHSVEAIDCYHFLEKISSRYCPIIIVIDDFISSGATINRIISELTTKYNIKKIDYLYISNSSIDVCKNALGENTKYINHLCLYR